MSTTENNFVHIKELGKSNYEIAAGDSDIRGWTVKNSEGNILGEVDDLLFDTEVNKVLYLVLDMEGNELNLKDRKVLVPMQVVDLHEGYKNVILPGVMANELTALPTYEKGKLNTKTVDLVVHAFSNVSSRDTQHVTGAGASSAAAADTAYDSNHVHSSSEHVESHAAPLSANTTNAEADSTIHHTEETHRSKVLKTVVGVYEHTNQAQAAIEYLIKNGFKRDQISISNRGVEDKDDEGITGFFRSLFKDDDDVYKYSEAAKAGAVITVDAQSDKEAEEAAEILDQLGALNMDERNPVREKYNSRIILRDLPPVY